MSCHYKAFGRKWLQVVFESTCAGGLCLSVCLSGIGQNSRSLDAETMIRAGGLTSMSGYIFYVKYVTLLGALFSKCVLLLLLTPRNCKNFRSSLYFMALYFVPLLETLLVPRVAEVADTKVKVKLWCTFNNCHTFRIPFIVWPFILVLFRDTSI